MLMKLRIDIFIFTDLHIINGKYIFDIYHIGTDNKIYIVKMDEQE